MYVSGGIFCIVKNGWPIRLNHNADCSRAAPESGNAMASLKDGHHCLDIARI